MHYHIRPLLQNKATLKWYRAVHFKNLTGWAERGRGIPRRGEQRFRVQGQRPLQMKNAPRPEAF